VRVVGTFETPWVNHVVLWCDCGTQFCRSARVARVRCPGCDLVAQLPALLTACAARYPPPEPEPDPSVVPPPLGAPRSA
jgi:hypothetical protein